MAPGFADTAVPLSPFSRPIHPDDKEYTMDFLKLLGVATLIGLLTACATPQEKAANAQAAAAKAQEQIAKQRLELVAKYQTCIKNAGDDQQKVAACDSFLKAAQALN
jgi:hypothetical protein